MAALSHVPEHRNKIGSYLIQVRRPGLPSLSNLLSGPVVHSISFVSEQPSHGARWRNSLSSKTMQQTA